MMFADCFFSLGAPPGHYYSGMFDTYFVMPEWEALITIASLSLTVLVTMVGNILVIISVFTHAPLKITPNFFIVSLAAGKS